MALWELRIQINNEHNYLYSNKLYQSIYAISLRRFHSLVYQILLQLIIYKHYHTITKQWNNLEEWERELLSVSTLLTCTCQQVFFRILFNKETNYFYKSQRKISNFHHFTPFFFYSFLTTNGTFGFFFFFF